MKKSLLALAVLGAFSGAAFAQTNITMYGVVDMALQHENDGVNSKTALDSGIQSGSRLGFKGSEDLGGGLKANFDLEMGMNADTGISSQGGVLFGRQAWVGLSGGFGSVNLGRQYTPIFIAVDSVDPFDAGIISGKAGVGTSSGGILTFFDTPFRSNNTVNYTTNNLGGFTGSLAYSFGEQAGSTSANRQLGASGTYANGPIFATLAYHKFDDIAAPGSVANPNATKETFLGGTYDFGVAKAHAAYGKTTSDLNSIDHKAWMLGVTVPVGRGAILGSYTRVKNNLVASANKGNNISVGYTYSLSKRTNLYTAYSRTSNDANSNAGGLAAANGKTDNLYNVGIRHKF